MSVSFPGKVLQAMKTWLYIYKRETPFEIVAVHVLFSRKGVIAQIQQCVVTKTDFVEIYDKVNKDGVSESEWIERMSEMWIEKNNYKQWWADPE
ncbi:hypothetical protein [Paenibacillus contaminans]|uniref:Uncharacterized protein n=1 Tax=Paenibacillus contaminans TaxID=450362 RepID=A0A329M312_9BACL|nr:hypothetical protein [Paenibacillus contaminans]RAV14168.1 hypothetical protein DQG23_31865 [Paenibacillus contaminans]